MAFLRVRNLQMRFGGLIALSDVSFEMQADQIYSLIGPNGAGKSTLFNCVSGLYRPVAGRIEFEGHDLLAMAPHRIAGIGIARTFQNIELFSRMTVMDNLLLGRHRFRRSTLLSEMVFSGAVRRQEVAWRRKVEEVIDFLDLQRVRDRQVQTLPYGTRKLVELARALACEPRLLLLDEPSAGMNVEEAEDLAITIRDIRRHLGIGVLMIEHDMRLVMGLSDRVCALNYGKVIAEGLPDAVGRADEVIEAYLGAAEATRT